MVQFFNKYVLQKHEAINMKIQVHIAGFHILKQYFEMQFAISNTTYELSIGYLSNIIECLICPTGDNLTQAFI